MGHYLRSEKLTPVVDYEPGELRLKTMIANLVKGFSIEVTPRESQKIERFADCLPLGTPVYVTWLRGADFSDTVRAVAKLRKQGMTPVPHLAARGIPDLKQLEIFLASLRDEADVQDILLIGGAMSKPAGLFDSTMRLLETGIFEKYGIKTIGVAGHPEGSPDITELELARALREKNAYAAATPIQIHITTQFCFDAAPISKWERDIRHRGNALAIHIGLAGLASLPTLLKHAKNCGIGPSMGVLTRQYSKLFKLASVTTPGKIVVELARSKLADHGSRIDKCHFYPFGSFAETASWATAVSAGNFSLTDDGTGLQTNA